VLNGNDIWYGYGMFNFSFNPIVSLLGFERF